MKRTALALVAAALALLGCATASPPADLGPLLWTYHKPGTGQAERTEAVGECIQASRLSGQERCAGKVGRIVCEAELIDRQDYGYHSCMTGMGYLYITTRKVPVRNCRSDTGPAALDFEAGDDAGVILWRDRLRDGGQRLVLPGCTWIRERCVAWTADGQEVPGEWSFRRLE
jgi:hypothetical protein